MFSHGASEFDTPGDNELVESVDRNVFAFAYLPVNLLMKTYRPVIDCDKKRAIYNKVTRGVDVDDEDVIGVIRLRSLPYPLRVKHLKVQKDLPLLSMDATTDPSSSRPSSRPNTPSTSATTVVGPNASTFRQKVSGNNPIEVYLDYSPGYYSYKPNENENEVEFCSSDVSFADRAFFGWFHVADLPLASEEVRALEFPVVCSLRDCLKDIYQSGAKPGRKRWEMTGLLPAPPAPGSTVVSMSGTDVVFPPINEATYEQFQPVTSDGANRPTPILVIGVPRMGRIDTGDIYGPKFKQATVRQVESKTEQIFRGPEGYDLANFISMEALEQKANPEVRKGAYSIHQLRTLLRTAMTGYAGARAAIQPNFRWPDLIINTGLWGCGEYGNNPGVIALVQLAAAYFTGVIADGTRETERPAVSRLVFHIGTNEADRAKVLAGMKLFYDVWASSEIVNPGDKMVVPDLFLGEVERKLKEDDSNFFHWKEHSKSSRADI
ncbi:hypothetical protein HK098_003334 [Nowakowskiella sp. JEL0407]|nr:hypothetical protein HK098_003334 [Nowakowskiella sp. JEL0407]